MRETEIAAIAEFGDVLPEVLLRDMDMRAADRTFQLAPMPFDGVGVMNATRPFLDRMIDSTMKAERTAKAVVTPCSSVEITLSQ